MNLSYLSVCSGIEAATEAWRPLGWKSLAFSEIAKFPSAVLSYRYPEVPNLGDMTEIDGADFEGLVDVLIGGTPCQGFSLAGLRGGLEDDRSVLAFDFVRIANGSRTPFVVWENVPGVLSDDGNAFGHFIAALAGGGFPAEPGPRPQVGKSSQFWRWDRSSKHHVPSWPDAGWLTGPERTIAWRILDAQYFSLAQRRRRVFVIACPRNGADPRKILLEFDGVRRDSPPRREARAGTAKATENRACLCGGTGDFPDDLDIVGPLMNGSGERGWAINAEQAASGHLQVTDSSYVPEIVSQAMSCKWSKGTSGPAGDEHHNLVATTLRGEGFDASEDGTGRQNLVVTPINTQIAMRHKALGKNTGLGVGNVGDPAFTLQGAHSHGVCIAFMAGQGSKAGSVAASKSVSPTLKGIASGLNMAPSVLNRSRVRRLTPVECARLQGFPDNHTLIPWNGKPLEACPDGPQYMAYGNSMPVPVIRWIGERIERSIYEKETHS